MKLPDSIERAGFVERAIAWAIDVAIVVGILVGLANGIAELFGWEAIGVTTMAPGGGWSMSLSTGFTILSLLVVFGYNILFWTRFGGATPGKRLFGLKVVRDDGNPLSFTQAAGRTCAYIASVPGLVGFLWAAFDRRHQTFHDKIAGTSVIRS